MGSRHALVTNWLASRCWAELGAAHGAFTLGKCEHSLSRRSRLSVEDVTHVKQLASTDNPKAMPFEVPLGTIT